MVHSKSPVSAADATYLRKIRKPLVEKKRRDRINNSLAQLKSLLAVNIKHNSTSAMARLDKADILELTVSHLTTLQHQHRSTSLATAADNYKKGFKDCARETFNYLSSTQALDADSLHRLNSHLHTCYIEETKRVTTSCRSDLHPAEMNSACATARPDVYSSAHAYQAGSAFHQQVSGGISYHGIYDHEQFLKEQNFYVPLNDSVDTSFNSSYNTSLMSLDASSSVTPEKIVPAPCTVDDMWRPW